MQARVQGWVQIGRARKTTARQPRFWQQAALKKNKNVVVYYLQGPRPAPVGFPMVVTGTRSSA